MRANKEHSFPFITSVSFFFGFRFSCNPLTCDEDYFIPSIKSRMLINGTKCVLGHADYYGRLLGPGENAPTTPAVCSATMTASSTSTTWTAWSIDYGDCTAHFDGSLLGHGDLADYFDSLPRLRQPRRPL